MKRQRSPRPGSRPGWPQLGEEKLASYALFDLVRVTRRSPSTAAEHSFLRLIAPDWVNIIAITCEGKLVLVELEQFTELIDDGVIEHSLVIAAHDHLQRGRRRGASWAGRLPGARNGASGPAGCTNS